jgi:hypothetical protein
MCTLVQTLPNLCRAASVCFGQWQCESRQSAYGQNRTTLRSLIGYTAFSVRESTIPVTAAVLPCSAA